MDKKRGKEPVLTRLQNVEVPVLVNRKKLNLVPLTQSVQLTEGGPPGEIGVAAQLLASRKDVTPKKKFVQGRAPIPHRPPLHLADFARVLKKTPALAVDCLFAQSMEAGAPGQVPQPAL